jgi:hypothetical protein
VSKLRWAKWFWADWSNDTALRLCSIPARGLWMEMLCLMAQGDPYGVLTVKGKPPTMAELRQLCRDPTPDPYRHYARDFARWFAELERHGVFQWVDIVPKSAPDARQARAICAPRLRHDGAIALARSGAATERWRVAESRQTSPDLHVQKPGNGSCLHVQKSILHTTEAEAEAEAGGFPLQPPSRKNPSKPPLSRGGLPDSISQKKRNGRHDA